MNNLFTLGCSYTDSYTSYRIPAYYDYEKFRGKKSFPKTWNELLSEKLNLPLINLGLGGVGNDYIFQTFCDNLEHYKKDDIVIIQWSYITRFKWSVKNPLRWIHNMVHIEDLRFFLETNISLDLLREKLTNIINLERTNKIYLNDVINYEKLINEVANHKGFKVYFWDGDYVDNTIIYFQNSKYPHRRLGYKYVLNGCEIFKEVDNRGGETIAKETKGLIFDLHMGELGHQVLCEILYEEIENINKNNLYNVKIESV
jgi:hypothetical protein